MIRERLVQSPHSQKSLKDYTNDIVIRMRAVPPLDATAMHSLEILHERCKKAGVQMVFSHVNNQPMRTMKKAGFYDAINAENFCKHIDDALKRAGEI